MFSSAEIYRQEGDSTMAIINYSRAIKLNPDDANIYYNRAALFEEVHCVSQFYLHSMYDRYEI